jgi:hypothetical protein
VAERIQFRNEDLFGVDLSDATVVMLFSSVSTASCAAATGSVPARARTGTMGDWQPKSTYVSRDRRDPMFLDH